MTCKSNNVRHISYRNHSTILQKFFTLQYKKNKYTIFWKAQRAASKGLKSRMQLASRSLTIPHI